jgi:tetratricopeptide (TPR) repeat protein
MACEAVASGGRAVARASNALSGGDEPRCECARGRRLRAGVGGWIASAHLRTTGVLAALAVLGLLAAARAGPVDDCNQVRDWRRQLHGCSVYIKEARAAAENLATAYLNRANIYARRRDYRRAFADYAEGIARDAHNVLLFYNRGNAYFDTRQYARATADYSHAIALDESFSLAYLNRGLAHERQGDSAAAAADYRRVLALDPKAVVAERRLKRLRSR